MEIIDEPTGLECWKLKIEGAGEMVQVSIQGPRGGSKGHVTIPSKDLLKAVIAETKGE